MLRYVKILCIFYRLHGKQKRFNRLTVLLAPSSPYFSVKSASCTPSSQGIMGQGMLQCFTCCSRRSVQHRVDCKPRSCSQTAFTKLLFCWLSWDPCTCPMFQLHSSLITVHIQSTTSQAKLRNFLVYMLQAVQFNVNMGQVQEYYVMQLPKSWIT